MIEGHIVTAREIIEAVQAQGKPAPLFFIELVDTTRNKSYGIKHYTAEEIDQSRVIGAWGKKERTFTAPFYMQRGHREVRVFASKACPITCAEYLYAQV